MSSQEDVNVSDVNHGRVGMHRNCAQGHGHTMAEGRDHAIFAHRNSLLS